VRFVGVWFLVYGFPKENQIKCEGENAGTNENIKSFITLVWLALIEPTTHTP